MPLFGFLMSGGILSPELSGDVREPPIATLNRIFSLPPHLPGTLILTVVFPHLLHASLYHLKLNS